MTKEINFGDHVKIEQKRHGAPNEFYFYKVIGTFRSNSYVEVPVQSPEKETIVNHEVVWVVACICCGVQEKDVRNFRLEDVKLVDRPQGFETTAYRSLNSRNAKLVHENDELMVENEKLKVENEILKNKVMMYRHIKSLGALK